MEWHITRCILFEGFFNEIKHSISTSLKRRPPIDNYFQTNSKMLIFCLCPHSAEWGLWPNFASMFLLWEKHCFSSGLVRVAVRKATVKQTDMVTGQPRGTHTSLFHALSLCTLALFLWPSLPPYSDFILVCLIRLLLASGLVQRLLADCIFSFCYKEQIRTSVREREAGNR